MPYKFFESFHILIQEADHLGSLLTLTNTSGTVVTEHNFDAWGRNRNPANWTYSSIPTNPTWLYRGFTGHEHVKEVALINMNGRMYDPVTCRMLSPDNYVPLPWNTQGYNRYGYANNNPLIYTDPDGNFFWLPVILGAVIAGVTQAIKPNANFGSIVGGALIGAAAGFFGAGVGNLAAGGSFFGNAVAQTVGFWAGAASGAAGGAAGGFVGAAGNAWLGGANFGQGLGAGLKGAAIGGIVGGLSNGITSGIRKANIEKVGKVEATDQFLRRAQKTWYPDAPMDNVKDFTVENLSDKAKAIFNGPKYNLAAGFTDTELTANGLLTGNSSVYFNSRIAFESSKSLYFTMGHELLHVSQISLLANQSFNSVYQSLGQMMEFQGYNYEAYLGRSTLNSFSQENIRGWVQNAWYDKLNFIAQPWLMLSKYKYIWR